MDRTFEPTFWLKLQRGEKVEQIGIAKPSGEVYELVELIQAVTQSVRDGTPVPCTGHDGWWSTALCLKAAESIQKGQAIPIQPI